MAAASALRSSLLLFGPPPGAEVVVVAAAGAGDGEPFVGLLLLRMPPIVWGCSYLRRWKRGSVCNGTLNAGLLFVMAVGARTCMYFWHGAVFFSTISSTKTRQLVI
jgi:hypothetical protein